MNLEGLIPIILGTYAFCIAQGIIKPASSFEFIAWREKNKKLLSVLSPLVVLFGILLLIGWL